MLRIVYVYNPCNTMHNGNGTTLPCVFHSFSVFLWVFFIYFCTFNNVKFVHSLVQTHWLQKKRYTLDSVKKTSPGKKIHTLLTLFTVKWMNISRFFFFCSQMQTHCAVWSLSIKYIIEEIIWLLYLQMFMDLIFFEKIVYKLLYSDGQMSECLFTITVLN